MTARSEAIERDDTHGATVELKDGKVCIVFPTDHPRRAFAILTAARRWSALEKGLPQPYRGYSIALILTSVIALQTALKKPVRF